MTQWGGVRQQRWCIHIVMLVINPSARMFDWLL
jgi:hypothetical protein